MRANRIPHVVLLSSIGGHLDSGTGPVAGLRVAEEEFREVAAGLTILRPAYFMENFQSGLRTMRESQSIFLPVLPDARLPLIATRDNAEVAAADISAPSTPERSRRRRRRRSRRSLVIWSPRSSGPWAPPAGLHEMYPCA
ncbi:MAG: hypothetical protein GF330_01960 [Candidatus Eisenbacteria bacterium]|nr:hypothetical protein [Candidatus Eisenbacteria bacterium]